MRALHEIAKEIRADWQIINNEGAREALECMEKMGDITERSGGSSNGCSVVSEFLTNTMGWRGETARRIKKELRKMCGHPSP